jgi:hypothetical protein
MNLERKVIGSYAPPGVDDPRMIDTISAITKQPTTHDFNIMIGFILFMFWAFILEVIITGQRAPQLPLKHLFPN